MLVMTGCPSANTSSPLPKRSAQLAAAIPDPLLIEITGSKKKWSAHYPSVAGHRDAGKKVAAGRDIHIPLDTNVVFILKSQDFVYTFTIPQYRLKEIAVPSLEFRMQLSAEKAGKLNLVGEPLCGEPHSEASGRIVVEPKDQFLNWLQM